MSRLRFLLTLLFAALAPLWKRKPSAGWFRAKNVSASKPVYPQFGYAVIVQRFERGEDFAAVSTIEGVNFKSAGKYVQRNPPLESV